ncbi:hypothetical protein F4820DRAFT_97407 [Hypoxylon rubiginosum]|uniref:Uncharacterized protein n=1 Tax=Hypoxylon rubiginosum TaxID=110542 RepID=A0ACB9YMX0_9PEZI|nr:hypothetical protein F4820DRAFT_97407 [Hypoxylon rubiginosum]
MPLARVKSRRVTQACDFCHRRGVKCREAPPNSESTETSTCLTCIEYGQECTRKRQPKKRGTKPRGLPVGIVLNRLSRVQIAGPFDVIDPAVSFKTSASSLDNRKIITTLLDVYLDTVHPSFPLFCEREIWIGWRDGSFPDNPKDYMSLMCMCALSAQHVVDGALFTDEVDSVASSTLAHDYLQEAVRLVPVDFEDLSMDLVRSYGFLALLGAQNGNHAMVHKYLGLYHGISARLNLHDESRWSPDTTECDREVQRRLWWAMYRLEIHTACVLGNPIRCSESQCNVKYPCGLHHPAFIPGRDGQFEDWFAGWNSTTDLYRVLEHAILDFRSKRNSRTSILGNHGRPTTSRIAERLSMIQRDLLPQFGMACSRSSDSGRNRCGFQASNILCTIHLARMISSISGENSLHSACETANDMISNLNAIPLEYVRAIGSPLVQQLAGVGHILVGVATRHRPSLDDYGLIKSVLISIIHFLEQLKDYNKTASVAEGRLANQLADLNQAMVLNGASDDIASGEATRGDVEVFSWSPFLDKAFPDAGGSSGDIFANLQTAFTWPYQSMIPGG